MSEKPMDAEKPFEATLAELEQVVRKLESGDGPLEKSLEHFERGVALAALCHRKLQEAQKRIEQATRGADGKLVLAPFDPDADEAPPPPKRARPRGA